jgi:hypothetical protein
MAPLPIDSVFSLPFSISAREYRSPSFPHAARDAAPPVRQIEPGAGTFDPKDINNRGIFALFALLGASLVLASIWFFFWAKNGGFYFRKGDWEEYKSTVLRRKGPNGKTLSGATQSTELGGGSVVPETDLDHESFVEDGVALPKQKKKKRIKRGKKNNADADMRAYRHEKPAQVGGINRQPDGSYHTEFTGSTEASEYAARPSTLPSVSRSNSPSHHIRSPSPTPTTPRRHRLHHFYRRQHSPPSSTTSSHRPLRRPSAPSTESTPTRSRRASPRKHHPRAPSSSVPTSTSYTEPLDFESRYTAVSSEAGETEDARGTKTYFHPIPGLAGHHSGGDGFRRGGGRGGRRDSLSDSEGEGTMLS